MSSAHFKKILLAVVFVLGFSWRASADTITMVGLSDSQDWSDSSNWSGGAVPTSADAVLLNRTGTTTLMISGINAAASSLVISSVDNSMALRVDSDASLAVGSSFVIGNTATGVSDLLVTGTFSAASMVVGKTNDSYFDVSSGGTVVTGTTVLGVSSGVSGGVSLYGSASSWTITGDLTVGDAGTSTAEITTGSSLHVSGVITLAKQAGSMGFFDIGGALFSQRHRLP